MTRLALVLAVAACGNAPDTAKVDAPASGDAPVQLDAPVDAGPCGMRTGMRGATNRTVHIASADRTYVVYLPANDDPHTPVPLVYVMHGYTMSGQAMYDTTGYPALADSQHI